MKNRSVLLLLSAVLVASLVFVSCAPKPAPAPSPAPKVGYPSKTIDFWVNKNPGGNEDMNARVLSTLLPDFLPSPVDVRITNIPAAAGTKALLQLLSSKPDGYTISVVNVPADFYNFIIYQPDVGTKILDLTWIAAMTTWTMVIAVSANSPYKTLKDLVGKKFKSPSAGGFSNYLPPVVAEALGAEISMVRGYKSSGEAMLGLIRGDAEVNFTSWTSAAPYVASGQVRVLAVFSEKREKGAPDVPTVGELGYPQLTTATGGRFVAGPPGMPEDIAATLSSAFMKSIENDVFKTYAKTVDMPVYLPALNREDVKKTTMAYYKAFEPYIPIYKAEAQGGQK